MFPNVKNNYSPFLGRNAVGKKNNIYINSRYHHTSSIRRKPESLQIHANHIQLQCDILLKEQNLVGRFKQFSAYKRKLYIVILGPVFPKKKEKRHLRMALVYSIMAFQDRRQHLAEQIFP